MSRAGWTVLVLCIAALHAQAPDASSAGSPAKGASVPSHAKGTFDVKVTPVPGDASSPSPVARMTLTKTLHGDLEGTGVGEMLAANTSVEGSAAYVAIERITGTIGGRSGSFMLQHTGTMTRGAPHLVVTVVPDSGTGDLVGLTGTFDIIIAGGKHSYDFAYSLPLDH